MPALNVETLMKRGREDYGWFMTHVLDVKREHFWPKMQEMCDSVRDNERTAVGAGHGCSKTFTLGRLVLAFLYCHFPSTVITTAPTNDQVTNLLWREIREAHANARFPLGGKLTMTMLDMQPETGMKWFAYGFSTRPDTITQEATAFLGYHNDHLLIIFDEAAGILPEIWRAAEHIGAPYKRFIAVGNPTSATGDFAAALKDPSYHQINISVTDTPNFKQGKTVIPGVYGVEYERRIRTKYGEDSDDYRVRVLGLVSARHAEGAFYARKLDELRKLGHIGTISHDPSHEVFIIIDPGYTTAIWLVQSIGTEMYFLRYYEDSGLSIADYVRLFEEWKEQFGYKYGTVVVPCDMDSNATKVVTGQSSLDTLRGLGYYAEPLPREFRVLDGIERTKQFLTRCWFDEKECEVGLDMMAQYHLKKNRQMSTDEKPVFTDQPDKDGSDHGCLVADTLIRTTKGQIPIQAVRVGDYVVTPTGHRKVLVAGLSGYATQLLEITTDKGRKLTCTPEHKIFFDNKVAISEALRYDSVLFNYGFLRNTLWNARMRLSFKDCDIGFREIITSGLARQPCIKLFGNIITVPCRRAIEYITKMVTRLTMTLQILNSLQKGNIRFCTASVSAGVVAKPISNTWPKPGRKPPNGIAAKKVKTFTRHLRSLVGKSDPIGCRNVMFVAKSSDITSAVRNTAQMYANQGLCGRIKSIMNSDIARRVEKDSAPSSMEQLKHAQRNVQLNREPKHARKIVSARYAAKGLWGRITLNIARSVINNRAMKRGLVWFARNSIKFTNTVLPERVAKIVEINYSREVARGTAKGNSIPVYDLTIEKDHCYYANDLLVSNSDALRYISLAAKLNKLSSIARMTVADVEELRLRHRKVYEN